MYKTERIDLRLSTREVEDLDQKRDDRTRSAFIRWLIETYDAHPHPDPVVPPLDPPIPTPIQPPAPPDPPVETVLSTEHDHEWIKGNRFDRCKCGKARVHGR